MHEKEPLIFSGESGTFLRQPRQKRENERREEIEGEVGKREGEGNGYFVESSSPSFEPDPFFDDAR